MRSFFKIFFASLLALFIFSIISFIILIAIIAVVGSDNKPELGAKGVLVLDLNKQYKEQSVEDPIAAFSGNVDSDIPGLYDVVRMIRFAKTDQNIHGIYIKCADNANGFAASEEIRNAILDFKTSKKFVIAYGEVISQKAYYVANTADKIYTNPKGGLDWRGFASSLFFMKGTLEKLEIEPQIFYAGKFKSATEPLRETEMTAANKLQTSVYLNDLYNNLLLTTAKKTGTDTGSLHALANSAAIKTAADALRYKLVDGVKYDDEVKSELIQKLSLKESDKINFITFSKYSKAVDFTPGTGSKIAIIYAEGEIIDGKGGDGQIGSDDFRTLIRKVRLNKDVKAIVLRVNSPGGSVLASEVIWREVVLAKKVKPVVVSFGDVAASGGYYISTHADSIFAEPGTITGSIGVFGIIPNMQNFFKNKMGITFDGVKTGPFADMMTISRPLNPAERGFIQSSIDTIYADFKGHVADGRKMDLAKVDSIAQGRVWTGKRAISIGLVDKIGNLEDAVKCAARMAKLSGYTVREYPEKKTFLQSLMGDYKEDVKATAIKEEIGEEGYKVLMQLKQVKKMIAIPQARLPFELSIH